MINITTKNTKHAKFETINAIVFNRLFVIFVFFVVNFISFSK